MLPKQAISARPKEFAAGQEARGRETRGGDRGRSRCTACGGAVGGRPTEAAMFLYAATDDGACDAPV